MSGKPKILVTNDDGVYAPGIFALWEAMCALGEVSVVAPESEKSAVGHAITISDPIRIETVSKRNGLSGYAVKGTPSDCVKVAVNGLLKTRPDIVVSGINAGANVGNNIIYSGTVSAATEGTMLGIPSVAFSLDALRGGDFTSTESIVQRIIRAVLKNGLPPGVLLNVNIPDKPINQQKGIKVTRQGSLYIRDTLDGREDPRGRQYFWMTGEKVDEDQNPEFDGVALEEGYVSVTPIHYQLTCDEFVEPLKRWNI